jgi:hypothetical protein
MTDQIPIKAIKTGSTATALAEFGVGDKIASDYLPTIAGYIDGLRMQWVSGTALTVTSGSAYIPGIPGILYASSNIAKTGLSLSASTWYHVYLYDNAGTPDIEIVTTAPAAPYIGTARSKTGDSSRRYVGSIITTPGGAVFAFRHSGLSVAYLTPTSATPFRVLSAGAATTETTVSAAPAVPLTSTVADVRIVNNGSDVVVFGTPDDAVALATTQFLLRVPPGEAYPTLQLDPTQQFTYLVAGSGGVYVDVRGYTYER